MGVQVTNNAVSTLAGSINTVVTALSVQAGHGARFPSASIVSGGYFYVTLIDAANNMEIVKVTDRTTDTFTIIRARDGTTARSFIANDRIELRPVAALFNALPNRELQTADYADLSVTSAKLATSAVTPGSYGGPGNPVAITVNSKGLVTALSSPAGVRQQDTFVYTGGAQTWTKPLTGGTWALIELWAGGGSGGKGRAGSSAGGGGGGQYVSRLVLLSTLGATENVSIGVGGAAQTVADSNGNVGGNTTFGSGGTLITAYGGGGGGGDDTNGANGGGHGGGPGQAGSPNLLKLNATYDVANYVGVPNEGVGGRAGVSLSGEHGKATTWNGAGGGGSSDGAVLNNGHGGDSVYGGGGGGAGAEDVAPGPGLGGVSLFGGNGGAGAFDASAATAGAVPAGGGGGSETGTSGAGGNGRVVVTVF